MLELVAHPTAEARAAWAGAPGIGADQAIRGFHSVTLWEEKHDPTEKLLVETLGFRPVGEEETTRRYAAGDGGAGTVVNVRAIGGFPSGAGGAGIVHHVAFRAADDAAQLTIREQVVAAGPRPPGHRSNVFHSVYFHEPGGVLFEIATDGPGFAIDEPAEHLGSG